MDLKVDRNYLLKFILDAVSLVVVGLPILLLNTVATPYWRGFNCDDESIRYPYKESTIPNFLLYLYGFGIPLIVIIGVEAYNARRNISTQDERRTFLWRLYCELVPFFFGVMISQLITDTAKYSIGRLRPHFFQICNPNIRCSIPDPRADIYQYIERYRCMGLDQDRIDDARKSFMSGHASFSAFAMTYTVFYLNHKVNKGLGLIKKLIQYILLLLAIYTGFTRISDYKHHWSDVLIGWLQGTVSAIAVCIYVAKLHRKRDEQFYKPVVLITEESTDSVA